MMKANARTFSAKPADFPYTSRKWILIDVEGKPLGRIATRIANILRGKNKPTFTAHVDTGDFVVVINAEKVLLTGNKMAQKIYYSHTGYLGGLKTITAEEMMKKKPEELIRKAVVGMLPKNKLNREVIKKLKIYAGANHPHEAQRPQPMEVL
ncbi:LSU ribosomal protein L13p (L13Ae) [hydrothermal vent metagenome]|uniref:LSU ribosomal protein L13p (L13Ae) n=1 Tax=hydrothermal vent metagenome TaxID=652676 RepID=A0A3B1BY54_9ZZZZ